jgi:phosphatidylserine decarboxylase
LIAGLIARRIILWKKQSDQVKGGERIGMIRFGSRVDLYLPHDVKIMVKKGQHVLAGKSVIGYWEREI